MGGRRDEDTPTNGILYQIIQDNDRKHAEGHQRLRADILDMEARIARTEAAVAAAVNAITRIETKPVDAASLIFSTQSVIAIVIGVLSIVGGSWLVNWPARNDISAILLRLNAKDQLDETNLKNQDDRIKGISDAVQTLQKDLKATEDRLRGEIRLKDYEKARTR